MERRYGEVLRALEADPNVRAIVVTGAGKAFCPGADLDVLAGDIPKAASTSRSSTCRRRRSSDSP
ncbi:enoyl-CoA hydratase-related protein [Kibdelosporangium philippinense]|uniref:enoyl-CoA hydratase-related protein n=1 Tax=Kibdelosporangium philippinense TaxID=211113 RepID=UPI0036156A10